MVLDGPDNGLIAVTDIDYENPRDAVDVGLAIHVHQSQALALLEDERVRTELLHLTEIQQEVFANLFYHSYNPHLSKGNDRSYAKIEGGCHSSLLSAAFSLQDISL
ncbi:MAG: hypothetical protein M1358_23830 [Chloroflexi bacterium]|nr:hypothetical protein [Chloroflexota bacterium]